MNGVMTWFTKNIDAGDLLIIGMMIFTAGGFYYTTTDDINDNRKQIYEHTVKEYEPLQSKVQINRERVQDLLVDQKTMQQRLESAIQRQDERYKQIQKQLQYIIERIDEPNR